ncbi:hypothetical protein G210_5241 [Candida maltosa Xu316]|uniref:Uncharacterized protein n=1 Tax=Candida maltosa (strain Xu316) TaxID=1245528 RepID=M3IG11_CANMX|nr:hypothetical protein G210_5241 [Candida maltosa Xu316]
MIDVLTRISSYMDVQRLE